MRFLLFVSCLLLVAAAVAVQQDNPGEPVAKSDSSVKPPRATFTPQPDFSSDAKRGKLDGVVVVGGYVGTDGKFHDAKIVRSIGDSLVDGKALAAVKSWKFRPCTKDGKSINCSMNIEVKIHLQ